MEKASSSFRETRSSSDKAENTIFKQVGDEVVVFEGGSEFTWEEYVEEASDVSLILGFHNKNGYGDGSDEIYLVSPTAVLKSHVYDDYREQRLHENVANPAGTALDLLDGKEMVMALAEYIYGQSLEAGAPWERFIADEELEEDDPMRCYGHCTFASAEVQSEFRRRVSAGRYPAVSDIFNSHTPDI